MESAILRKPVSINLIGFVPELPPPKKKKTAVRKQTVAKDTEQLVSVPEEKSSLKEEFKLPAEAIDQLAESAKSLALIFDSMDETTNSKNSDDLGESVNQNSQFEDFAEVHHHFTDIPDEFVPDFDPADDYQSFQ